MKNSFFVEVEKKSNDFINLEARARAFIHWLDETGRRDFVRSKEEISEQFADEFEYIVNHELRASNAESLSMRFKKGNEIYKTGCVGNIEELKIDKKNNGAHAKYGVTFVLKNGDKEEATNTVYMSFNQEGKVRKLDQVFTPPLIDIPRVETGKSPQLR